MSCRQFSVKITVVEKHVTSHGTTCCVCRREFGETFLHVEHGSFHLGACSMGCAFILGQWLAVRPDREICLAHTCRTIVVE